MTNFNLVVLAGRLTRDIEIRNTSGGVAVANIGLCVNRRVKKGEQWIEEPVFVDVTMFGNRAEVLASSLRKGDPVLFEGELSMDTWEDKNGGGKRSKLKVIASGFQFVGGRREEGLQGAGGAEESIEEDGPF